MRSVGWALVVESSSRVDIELQSAADARTVLRLESISAKERMGVKAVIVKGFAGCNSKAQKKNRGEDTNPSHSRWTCHPDVR